MKHAAVIADVHGEAKQFEQLILKILAIQPETNIFSLGDLIDRGPDSCTVLDLCLQYNIKGILGNHELWLRDLFTKAQFDTICLDKMMGGKATISSYGVSIFSDNKTIAKDLISAVPSSHVDYLTNLPSYRKIQIGSKIYFLLHSGINHSDMMEYTEPNLSDEDILDKIIKLGHAEFMMMWNTPQLPTKNQGHGLYKFKKAIQIFGHRPVPQPIIHKDFIALDTGCGTCLDRKLSAILLPSMQIIQQAPNE